MGEAAALREKLNGFNSRFQDFVNDMIVKASALALEKYPAVNAVYRDDKVYPGAASVSASPSPWTTA